MPKEKKKRGRRLQEKPYSNPIEKEDPQVSVPEEFYNDEHLNYTDESAQHGIGQQAFYGLLEESQVEYFKQTENIIDSDSFGSKDEKSQLFEALWNEISGIELKVMTDPTGSRIFERLLHEADKSKILEVYEIFTNGRFAELSTQRFSSHCCETLINCSRSFVAEEVEGNRILKDLPTVDTTTSPVVSLTIDIFEEIKDNLQHIAFHPFGTHVFRSLLLLFSGKALAAGEKVLSTKKTFSAKRNSSSTSDYGMAQSIFLESFAIPMVYQTVLESILNTFVANLSIDQVRSLAQDSICSPVLQALFEIESSLNRTDLLTMLLPGWQSREMDFITTSYVEKLLNSPVGSHFLDKIILCAPLKFVKYLYSTFFLTRMKIIRQAQGFNYAVKSLLSRLKKDSSTELITLLLDDIKSLSVNNIVTLNNITQAAGNNNNLEEAIGEKIVELCDSGLSLKIFLKLADIDEEKLEALDANDKYIRDGYRQRSMLMESLLLKISGTSLTIVEGFIALKKSTKLKLAKHPIYSHLLEAILHTKDLSTPNKRKLLNDFMGSFVELSCDPSASRVVDACKETSSGLNHYRDRFAKELISQKDIIMKNAFGRKVWKNWKLDLFSRSPAQWIKEANK
ncbi:armadillo-type protein [Dipodascopsis uninucleata]